MSSYIVSQHETRRLSDKEQIEALKARNSSLARENASLRVTKRTLESHREQEAHELFVLYHERSTLQSRLVCAEFPSNRLSLSHPYTQKEVTALTASLSSQFASLTQKVHVLARPFTPPHDDLDPTPTILTTRQAEESTTTNTPTLSPISEIQSNQLGWSSSFSVFKSALRESEDPDCQLTPRPQKTKKTASKRKSMDDDGDKPPPAKRATTKRRQTAPAVVAADADEDDEEVVCPTPPLFN